MGEGKGRQEIDFGFVSFPLVASAVLAFGDAASFTFKVLDTRNHKRRVIDRRCTDDSGLQSSLLAGGD